MMKPQLYSIVILLLARINYGKNTENSTQVAAASSTQLPLALINKTTTSVAKTPEDNVTSTTKALDDHKTSAPENKVTSTTKAPKGNTTSVAKTPEDNVTSTTKVLNDHKTSAPENNVTSTTKAPKGTTTSVAKTSHETTDKATILSKATNSKATSAPSLAPDVSPVRTTKGFTMTSRSGVITRATRSTSISIRNQTSTPIVAGNANTQWINNVTNATRPTSTKSTTDKTTGNRTSTFPVPSLFAIVLLVVSILCF